MAKDKSQPVAEETKPAAAPTQEAVPEQDSGANMVRKLSPKTVVGDLKKIAAQMRVNEDRSNRVLYRVMGVSHGIKADVGDNGPWVAFLGAFEAVRADTGEIFQAGQCFVPKAVEDLLVASLKAGQKGDASASIEFAIEVGMKLADTAVGYEFTVKNLVKTQNADPLAALRSRMMALPAMEKPKALAAPSA